jgi:hypothetical protein
MTLGLGSRVKGFFMHDFNAAQEGVKAMPPLAVMTFASHN